MRVLIFGDSITQGFWGIEGGWVERLRKHYDTLAIKDLKNNKQPEIFNLGISGDTTKNLLIRIENETKVRKWPGESLLVVIAIGTNDDLFEHDKQWVPPDEFERNLETIINMLELHTNGLLLVGNPACDEKRTTPLSWGDYHYTNKELEKSEAIINHVAIKYKLPYVPIFSQFKTKLDQGENLLADGLHPNDAGHQFIAHSVLPELNALIKLAVQP